MPARTLKPGQTSQVFLAGTDLDDPQLLLETSDLLLEAPNWTTDGTHLVLNGDGALWTLDATRGGRPARVPFEGLPDINNDHVLAPDGDHVYLSAMDTHVYRGSLAGGPVERMTPDDGRWHFLHGVSPDGTRLAYVEIATMERSVGRLVVLEADGSTRTVDTGPDHIDGPEWSPDGTWIYFNTEGFTTAPGHAQLARVPDGGGEVEHLVSTGTVDWFPHLSPDGAYATSISFPAGTLGHPADLDVEVRLVATSDWTTPLRRYPLFGGQGTLNVNSWSPDSTRFAYVAYPVG